MKLILVKGQDSVKRARFSLYRIPFIWAMVLFLDIVLNPASGSGSVTGPFARFEDQPLVTAPSLWSKGTTHDTGGGYPIHPLPGDDCQMIQEFNSTDLIFAQHFDSSRHVTELYVGDYTKNQVIRHDIDASLHDVETALPITGQIAWISQDLDGDGNIELVLQGGDVGIGGNAYLEIRSSPDWQLRGRFIFPDRKFYMYPVAVNLDDDEELELYVNAYGFGNPGMAAIIDYDPLSDSFAVVQTLLTPPYTGGQPAVGDFDGDGRIEFIVGDDFGYLLFEHNGDSLSFVDRVVEDTVPGVNKSAAAVRPKRDGALRALLGHSSGAYTSRYQLLRAVADNEFVVEEVFQVQESVGGGVHPCFGADIDCDGLDEMIMYLWPVTTVIEWDESARDYVAGCKWDAEEYGVPFQYQATDLDQDGAREWAVTDWTTLNIRTFENERCPHCWRVDRGLVGWWPFDLGDHGKVRDYWSGLDGQEFGATSIVNGLASFALFFDGIDDYVRVRDAAKLNIADEDFSFDAWFASTNLEHINPLTSKSDSHRGWSAWIEDGIHLAVRLQGDTASTFYSDDRSEFSDGDWHHVAVAVGRAGMNEVSFYLDGARIRGGSSNAFVGNVDSHTDLLIGALLESLADTAFFSGMLDEISLWDRALDFETVTGIYQARTKGKCRNGIKGCDCAAHGDVANDDGIIDVADVSRLGDFLFRAGAAPTSDPDCPHTHRGDVNCDGLDNVLDMVLMVDHAFRNGNTPFCNPCGCDPYPRHCR